MKQKDSRRSGAGRGKRAWEKNRAGRRAGLEKEPGGEQRPRKRPRCAGGNGGGDGQSGEDEMRGEDKRGKGGEEC